MIKFVVFSLVCFAVASAMPFLVEDGQGQQYYIEPVLERHRRDAQWSGAGGANGHTQGGYIAKDNPNGSGFSASYSHTKGMGQTVGADVRVPVWSKGGTTVNLGGGATQHFGGPAGNMNLDKRVEISVNHSW